MHRALTGLLIALLFAGAARAEAPDFKATAHKVAIVSLLGDTINVNDGLELVPGAGFDSLSEQAMARQIATDLPGASVVRVGGPRAPLLTQMYPNHGFGDLGLKQVRAALELWAEAHHVDYIVILRKTAGTIQYRSAGYSMTTTISGFGIGFVAATPTAFLNVTVCNGKTLEVVAELSARDLSWGSHAYALSKLHEQLPDLTEDVRAMLDSLVPGLVHGVGL